MTDHDAVEIRALEIAQEAKTKIESHEEICAIRYMGINASLSDIKKILIWFFTGGATVALTVIGYLFVKLYG